MILAPIIDRGAGDFASKRGAASKLDATATGSILKKRGFTVRRSVLQGGPGLGLHHRPEGRRERNMLAAQSRKSNEINCMIFNTSALSLTQETLLTEAKTVLKKFSEDRSGATAIEYGLIGSLIAVAVIGGFRRSPRRCPPSGATITAPSTRASTAGVNCIIEQVLRIGPTAYAAAGFSFAKRPCRLAPSIDSAKTPPDIWL